MNEPILRFRWRRSTVLDRQAYAGTLAGVAVAHVSFEPRAATAADPFRWIARLWIGAAPQPDGWASTPREAALAAELTYFAALPSVRAFDVRPELAADLAEALGVPLPRQNYRQAIRAGIEAGPLE